MSLKGGQQEHKRGNRPIVAIDCEACVVLLELCPDVTEAKAQSNLRDFKCAGRHVAEAWETIAMNIAQPPPPGAGAHSGCGNPGDGHMIIVAVRAKGHVINSNMTYDDS